MTKFQWRSLRLSQTALPVCLLAQAALMMTRIDLLPVWGDEYFTLKAVSGSVGQTIGAYAADSINPPLHPLLVQFWLWISGPIGTVEAVRLLSVLFALASTIVFERLWLRGLSERARLWFLLFWTFSPCLLLYARMARSYSLQVLVFAVVLWLAVDLVKGPRLLWRGFGFSLGVACLLYLHYLPGIALLVSVLAGLAWCGIRGRQKGALGTAAGVGVMVFLLYAPWIPKLWGALGHMARSETPLVETGFILEAVRVGYWLFSFSFGEMPSLWVLISGALLLPAVLLLVWKGAGTQPRWLWILVLAALIAYVGAARWVSFVFTPARLLFLLPFFFLLLATGMERAGRFGNAVGLSILCLSALSIVSYYRQSDFLNKSYLLPYGEIAQIVNEKSAGRSALLIADTWNTDPSPLFGLLSGRIEFLAVTRDSTESSLRKAVAANPADIVWYFRNSHDTSPGGMNTRLAEYLRDGRHVEQHLFVPYSDRDMLLMRLLGWPQPSTHLVQLLEMRRN